MREPSAGWDTCSRTVLLDSPSLTVSYWNNTIAVGLQSGDIVILDAITGIQRHIFSGHSELVQSVTFSSDGAFLVSGSFDKTINLWDMQTGGIIRTFVGHSRVQSVSISANSTMIALRYTNKTIRLWDLKKRECRRVMEQLLEVSHVSFLPTNSQHLMVISQGTVQQWDINGHQIGPRYAGSCIAFSLDGTQLILCNKSVVTVQNTESGAIIAKFHVDSDVYCCCFSPDGRFIAAVVHGTALVWDITSSDPHLVETFGGNGSHICDLTFSSSSTLVSAAADGQVRFWQISAPMAVPIETSLQPTSYSLAKFKFATLHAADGMMITGNEDGVVKTWDILTGHCTGSFQTPLHGFGATDVCLVNYRLILAWHDGKKLCIWDVEKQEPLLAADSIHTSVNDLKISGNGKVFYLYGNFIGVCSIWTGQMLGRAAVVIDFPVSLIVDGNRAWAQGVQVEQEGLVQEGWDFEIPDSPVQSDKGFPSKLHPNGNILWNVGLFRVQEIASGKILFQLNAGLGKPADVQWNDKYLFICFLSGKVLILDFSYVLLFSSCTIT